MENLALLANLSRPAAEQPLPVLVVMVLWALAAGSSVGSFLNVVIARVPEGLSVVSPRSRCPRCEKPIAWYDNIPLFSWLMLRARCRSCSLPISARYPFVELLVGGLAVAIAARWGFSVTGLELFVFACVLVAVAFIDLDTWTIPFVFPGILVVLGLVTGGVGELLGASWAPPGWVQGVFLEGSSPFLERLIGAVAGLLVLGLINVVATYMARAGGRIGPEEFAMGWGDPLLLGAMGAVLGWRALPLVVFLASAQGAVAGIALALAGRMPGSVEAEKQAERREQGEQGEHGEHGDEEWTPPPTAMPFGPFLALAGLEVAFFGGALAARLEALWSL